MMKGMFIQACTKELNTLGHQAESVIGMISEDIFYLIQ